MKLLPPLLSHLALAFVMVAAPAPRPDDDGIAGLHGEWELLAIADFDDDGELDVCVWTGDTVVILWDARCLGLPNCKRHKIDLKGTNSPLRRPGKVP